MSDSSWIRRAGDGGARPADWSTAAPVRERPLFPVEPVNPAHEAAPPRDPAQNSNLQRGPAGKGGQNADPEPRPRPQASPASPAAQPAEPNAIPPEVEHALSLMASAVRELVAAREAERERATDEAVQIGLTVAEELAAGAIEVDPARVLDLVFEAMSLLGEGHPVVVRIHPEIFKLLDAAGKLADFANDPRIELRSDPAVADLGCIVESSRGKVDARVRARLLRLKHLLSQGEGHGAGGDE